MSTFDAGSIDATLTLDRTPFVRDLKRAREQARRFSKTPIKVPLTADRTRLTRDLKNAREQIRRFTSGTYAVNIDTNVDTVAAERKIAGLKESANSLGSVTINADADTLKANAKLDYLKHEANEIERDKITIKVKADTAKASGRLSLLQSQMLAANSGSSLLIGTITGAGPAMVPILAAAAGAAGSLASALAAAGAGAAVVGASVVGNFMKMKEQTDLVTAAQKKLRDATNAKDRKAAVQQLAQARRHLAGLPGPINGAAQAFLGMQRAWNNFLKATQGDAFRIITRGLNMIANFMPRLVPLFNAFSGVILKALGGFQRWVNGPAFQKFLDFITRIGPPAMAGFIKIGFNLARTFMNILQAFGPMANDLVGGLVRITGSWAKWTSTMSKNAGFQQFLQLVRQLAPIVTEFIGNLAKAALHLVVAMLPIGTVVLKALNGILKFIAGMDPHVLAGIVTAILGVVTAISLLNGVVGFIAGAAGSVVKAIGFIGTAIRGLSAAFTFLAANPVVLVIAAIAALGIALFIAYKKSETFRNFVNGMWAGIKSAAQAVASWFAGPFVNFFTSSWQSIQGAWGAAVGWFQGLWDGIRSTAQNVGNFFVGMWRGAVNTVQSVWKSLQNAWTATTGAISAAYHTVIDPVIRAFQTAWGAVASYIRAVWRGWIFPVFDLLGAIIKKVLGTYIKVYVAIFTTAWHALGAVMRAVWNSVIHPVINGVATAIRWLVNNVAKPLWRAMQAAWSGLGSLIRGINNRVIQPTFHAVADLIRWLVNNVAKPLWHAMQAAWSGLGAAIRFTQNRIIKPTINAVASTFRWLWNNVAKPIWRSMQDAWSGLGDLIRSVYNHTIKPVISFFADHIKDVRTAFNKTVDGIRAAWNRIEDIAKKPIHFVLDTVVNHGLIAGFNKLAGVFHTSKMSPVPVPFASGGVLPGYSPGRDIHQFYSPTGGRLALSGGEAIMRPEFTRAVGGEAGIEDLNARARAGKLAFAGGGVFGWVGDALNTVKNAAGGALNWGKNFVTSLNPIGLMKKAIGSALNGIGGSAFADLVKSGAKNMLSGAWKWMQSKVGFGGGAAAKGPHLTGSYRWLEALVARAIPNAVVTSDYRPGAMTIYGTPSSHGLGKAVDWGYPMKAIWNLLYPLRGRLHELLGPWGMFRNGAPYHDPTLQAMHENHVHAATFRLGGLIPDIPVFDRGGTLGPGANLVYNARGSQEGLVPEDTIRLQNDKVARLLEAVLVELRKRRQVALTPDGRRQFEAVLEEATAKVNTASVRKAYLGRKDS